MSRRRLNCGFYCLQVFFCAVVIWAILFNIILYFVLPSNVPEPLPKHHDDEKGHTFITLAGVVTNLLTTFSEISSESLILIQPEALSSLDTFTWLEYSRRERRILTFLTLGEELPACETLQQYAQRLEARIFCKEDNSHVLISTSAALFHLISTKKINDLFLATGFIDNDNRETLAKMGISGFSSLTFVDHPGVLLSDAIVFREMELDAIKVTIPTNIPVFLREILASTFIECDKNRAKSFMDLNPDMKKLSEASETVEFRRKVRQILQKSTEVLNKLHIPYWLSSGTCLGWYRQCDVIPYSMDVDLGVHSDYTQSSEAVTDLIEAMEDRGLRIRMRLGMVNDSLQLAFMEKDVKLDIYFFYDDSDGKFVWNGATKPETGEKYRYTFPKFNLCWSDFLDMTVRVPCEAETYLSANYGNSWSEPKTSWDWRNSPPNSQPNGKWSSQSIDDAVQIFYH